MLLRLLGMKNIGSEGRSAAPESRSRMRWRGSRRRMTIREGRKGRKDENVLQQVGTRIIHSTSTESSNDTPNIKRRRESRDTMHVHLASTRAGVDVRENLRVEELGPGIQRAGKGMHTYASHRRLGGMPGAGVGICIGVGV